MDAELDEIEPNVYSSDCVSPIILRRLISIVSISSARPLSSFLTDILHACSGPRILTLSGSPHEVRRTSKLLPALINAPPYKSIMRFIVVP